MNRIAITGSHGVGKTTLLNAINHHHKIQELARKHLIRDVKPSDMTFSERLIFQNQYWHMQICAEYEHRKTGFLSDRSLIDIIAYSQKFIKAEQIKTMFCKVIGKYDWLFYIPIEFGLEVDAARSHSIEYQRLIDNNIILLLKKLGDTDSNVKIRKLVGTTDNRKNQFNSFISKDY